MSDSEHKQVPTSPAGSAGEAMAVLPETLRQQYLGAMDIQVWYDPQLQLDSPVVAAPGDSPAESRTQSPASSHRPASPASHSTQADPASEQHADSASSAVAQPQAHSLNSDESSQQTSQQQLASRIAQCQLCELHSSRQQAVVAQGDSEASLMVVVDAPADNHPSESAFLEPLVRPLFSAMLGAIGLELPAVYITSLVKCQPPGGRAPQATEVICCEDHLSAQIKQVQPDVILVLGELASQQLLLSQKSLTDLRLRQHSHLGVAVFASYHPQQCLQSAELKRKVWQDLLQIKHKLKKINKIAEPER